MAALGAHPATSPQAFRTPLERALIGRLRDQNAFDIALNFRIGLLAFASVLAEAGSW